MFIFTEICPRNVSVKLQLSSTRPTSSSSLQGLNSPVKTTEIRRHSETPGNCRKDTFSTIEVNKKDKSPASTHCPPVDPLQAKTHIHSLSCDNIVTMAVSGEESREKDIVKLDRNGKTNDEKHVDPVSGAWEILEEEISDVNLLIETYSEKEYVKVKVVLTTNK